VGNTSLENVALGIPYDVITATVGTKKVGYYFAIEQKKIGKLWKFIYYSQRPPKRLGQMRTSN